MKQLLSHTKCTVKLRKSEYHDEWYLIVESYPVFIVTGSQTSCTKEALNRTVTTSIWDKNRNARTSANSTVTCKLKRDANGVTICRSEIDNEACLYAGKVRAIRQMEYDNAALYTDSEAEQTAQNKRSQFNFIEKFKQITGKRHKNSSDSIIVNWSRVYELLKIFAGDNTLLFEQTDLRLIENFKLFLLNVPQGGSKSRTVSRNTTATYFSILKAGLKQAFMDGYLTIDLAAKVKGIPEQESFYEHLTLEVLNILEQTPCNNSIIKHAVLICPYRHQPYGSCGYKEDEMEKDCQGGRLLSGELYPTEDQRCEIYAPFHPSLPTVQRAYRGQPTCI